MNVPIMEWKATIRICAFFFHPGQVRGSRDELVRLGSFAGESWGEGGVTFSRWSELSALVDFILEIKPQSSQGLWEISDGCRGRAKTGRSMGQMQVQSSHGSRIQTQCRQCEPIFFKPFGPCSRPLKSPRGAGPVGVEICGTSTMESEGNLAITNDVVVHESRVPQLLHSVCLPRVKFRVDISSMAIPRLEWRIRS